MRLSELHLFFENSKQVKEHPVKVAKSVLNCSNWRKMKEFRVFHKSIEFLLRHVVAQMRIIGMDEMELVAFSGILLWTESGFHRNTRKICTNV